MEEKINKINCLSQGAKKVSFTACHLGKLQLNSHCTIVILISPQKTVLITVFCNMDLLKKNSFVLQAS